MNLKIHKNRLFLTQTVLLWLCFAFLIAPLALTVSATAAGVTELSVSPERFCASVLKSTDAYLNENEDGTVSISVNGKSPAVNMEASPIKCETKANSLRIVLKNTTESNVMTLEYVYKNSAQISVTATAKAPIKKSDEAVEYIVPVESPDTMTRLSIAFEGDGDLSGDITMVSVAAISYYFDDKEYFGELVSNIYNRETGMAEFSGTVSYDTLVENSDAKIALYRLRQNENIDDVKFFHSYVTSCPMTLNFKFDFQIKSTSEACSRYFAAILTNDNRIIPLTSEVYLKEKKSEHNDEKSSEVGFKGIETNLYSGASENGTSVAFVDVYLDRVLNDNGDGFQYALSEGKEYYFDRAYIASLDTRIKSHSAAGSDVYLRFLISTEDPALGYLGSERPSETEYFALNPYDDETVDNIYACTDFIVSRYSSDEYGVLRGVILGRSLDKALKYNYCGGVSMSEYADMLARSYSIIRHALDRSSTSLEIVLPVSDGLIGAETLMTVQSREQSYPADILSELIVMMLDRYGSDITSLYFMLESENAPELKLSQSASGFMGAADHGAFTDMVEGLSALYDDLPDKMFFCWFPSMNLSSHELITFYMYNYNFLAVDPLVRGYVVSMFERDELVDMSGFSQLSEEYIFSSLKNTYKYADTAQNLSVSAPALYDIGASNWSDVIKGYEENKMVKRNLVESDLLYTLPSGTKGTYRMWSFFDANGSNGWNSSDGCLALSVYTPSDEISRALIASFKTGTTGNNGADYGSLIYHAPESLIMEDISAVSFDLLIPSSLSSGTARGELFEVKITVGSDNVTYESVGVIKCDERSEVYADIAALDRVQYIKVSVRSLERGSVADGFLCINSISIHSDVHDDKTLEGMVRSGALMSDGNEKGTADGDNTYIIIASVVGCSIVAVTVVWLAFSAIYKKHSG